MGKGPAPRLDLAKKGLEELKESDLPKDEKAEKILSLFLESNKLTKVPATFAQHFANLKVLYLSHNHLTAVPEEICSLNFLVKLHLENNQIKSLPKDIGKLGNLKKLYLQNNELEELPDEISSLGSLVILNLTSNNLKILNPHISAVSSLQQLAVVNNPIGCPPPFVFNRGMNYLMMYLREIRESLTFPCPQDEFIFSRHITFADQATKLKRSPSTKTLSREQGKSFNQQMKVLQAEKDRRSGSPLQERHEDSPKMDHISLDQNHLLYFLTEYGFCAEQGRRDYMEDRVLAIPRLHQKKPSNLLDEVVNLFSKVGIFGVYDGHGGARAADYLLKHLHVNICNQESYQKGDFETALKTAFKRTDDEFLKLCRENYYMDGTTAVVAMVIDNKLITGHAGDSRAVLCRDKKAIRLTEDHKPDRVDELTRIEELGGEVIFRGNCFRVSGDLAMSRSFGDLRLKDPVPLVLSEPEIRVEDLSPSDEFVIIASDGLWDVLSDQKAVDLVRKCNTATEASRKLVETALALGTMDNTSAIVVKFNWALEFLTHTEIEDGIPQKPKDEQPKFIPAESSNKDGPSVEEMLARTRSNSQSFRESYVNTIGFKSDRKSIYLPTSSDALILKVLIPQLSATKLLKFDSSTLIKEIIMMMIKKHRFAESLNAYELYLKGPEDSETLLEPNKKISDYPDIKADSQLLMKHKTGGEFKVVNESPNESFPEVLPSAEVTKQAEDFQVKSGNAPPPEVKKMESFAAIYKLEEGQWVQQDAQSKLGIYECGGRFRLVVLSSTKVYLLNAWILKEYPFKPPAENETFATFSTVIHGSINHFGFRFGSVEVTQEFSKVLSECVAKLLSS